MTFKAERYQEKEGEIQNMHILEGIIKIQKRGRNKITEIKRRGEKKRIILE